MAKGGMCGEGGHAWQGLVCGRRHVWQEGHAWQGGCVVWGMCGRGVCVAGGHGRGVCMAGQTATAVDSTHPTGVHSCVRPCSHVMFF